MASGDESTVDRAETELERADFGPLLVPACSDILVLLDEDGAVRYVSPSFRRLLGRDSKEIVDGSFAGLFHDEDRERATKRLSTTASDLDWGDAIECRMRHVDGSWRTMEMHSRSLEEHHSAVSGSVVTFRDITDRKEFEVALERSARHQRLLSLVPSPVFVLKASHEMIYVNNGVVKLFETTDTELLGRSFLDLALPEDREKLGHVLRRAGRHDRGAEIQVRMSGPRTGELVLELRFLALDWDGDPAIAGFAQDITRWTSDQEDLRRRAMFDELTGLPNRTLLRERLDHALTSRARTGSRPMVMFLDIDRFKAVNDSFGHQAGDAVLVEVASRLQAVVRPQDTVARFGGDEFVVLVDDAEDLEQALAVARRIAAGFSAAMDVHGTTINVTASAGLAGGPDLDAGAATSASDLLQAADTAMYEAKSRGGGIEFYTPALQRAALDHLCLEADLRQALDDGDIDVAFQPIVSLDGRDIVGVEALARWAHRERGDIGPGTFVPVAEDVGLVSELGRQVLRNAMEHARVWAGEGRVGEGFPVHVNVSAHQLGRSFVSDVASLIDGLPPEVDVLLELTESVLMREDSGAHAVLHELREAGARIGIDDFGTGYSSLAYLSRLPADTMKLDRQFVSRLDDGRASRVAGAVVALGATLGMQVVAEGVEERSEESALRQLGVEFAQGYRFGKPMPAAEVRDLLETP